MSLDGVSFDQRVGLDFNQRLNTGTKIEPGYPTIACQLIRLLKDNKTLSCDDELVVLQS